jgi:hypothetical protein
VPQTTALQIAETIAASLSGPSSVRPEYAYAVPSADGVASRYVDAAVFSAFTPSFRSVAVGIAAAAPGAEQIALRDLGYLGAPLVLLTSNEGVAAYEFTAPLVPELVAESAEPNTPWLRDLLPRVEDQLQLPLPGLEARELVLDQTTSSLKAAVGSLMADVATLNGSDAPASFSTAISLIRHFVFGQAMPGSSKGLRQLASLYRPRIAFDNIPVESVSELYESLAIEDATKRPMGVFYTPSWLARRIVDRLPQRAFDGGRAVDPACGSGTFLVCFLERLLEERSRRNPLFQPSPDDLVDAVGGVDVDVVALESSRLTLDLLAARFGLGVLNWNLQLEDATEWTSDASTLVGNMPFGYRTHNGTSDISTAILERWIADVDGLKNLAVLLPESVFFAQSAGVARRRLLSEFRVEELIRLPETAFETSKVPTVAILATKGAADEVVVVRDVDRHSLETYRATGVARSFTSILPSSGTAPWVISPFYSVLATAERRAALRLGDNFDVHKGLQPYGSGPEILEHSSDDPSKRLLDDAKAFLNWTPDSWRDVPRLQAEPSELRRPGPVDKFPRDKLVVRSLTNRHQRGRLAGIYDTHGLWFTDRFVGVWAREPGVQPSIKALTAYLQTAFAELWFASSNPSRTLKVAGLRGLPIPRLPDEWWERSEALCAPDHLTVSPRWLATGNHLIQLTPHADESEWQWFEAAVLASFGIASTTLEDVSEYLIGFLDVGRYPS